LSASIFILVIIFIRIEGSTLENRAGRFAKKGKSNVDWAFSSILKFVQYQNIKKTG
jgi:hypothetical protein